MRKLFFLGIFLSQFLLGFQVNAQSGTGNRLFRVYMDNDFLNYRGRGTDNAYTSGFRLDVFFLKNHDSRFFIDKVLPKAGNHSTDVFQWGVMQVMYTPNDLTIAKYQPGDYSYAGGLYAIHSLYSYNAENKLAFQTELDAGVRGPWSLAEAAQKLIHQVMDFDQPVGWSNQLKTKMILNLHFSAEKQLVAAGHFLEIMAGGKVSAGTLTNALSVYPLIRIGKMNPYFDGYIRQYSSLGNRARQHHKTQFYLIIRPELQWVLTNAMLEGGIYGRQSMIENSKRVFQPGHQLNHLVYSFNCGAVASTRHFSLSLLQNTSTMLIKNTYDHAFGNVSLYYNW